MPPRKVTAIMGEVYGVGEGQVVDCVDVFGVVLSLVREVALSCGKFTGVLFSP